MHFGSEKLQSMLGHVWCNSCASQAKTSSHLENAVWEKEKTWNSRSVCSRNCAPCWNECCPITFDLCLPSPSQVWRVRDTVGRHAEAAGCGRGWKENPELSVAYGHPAETGPDAAPGGFGVRPRAGTSQQRCSSGWKGQNKGQRRLFYPSCEWTCP